MSKVYTSSSVMVTTTQVTMPLRSQTVAVDGTKINFAELRGASGYRSVKGLPIPQPRRK